MKIFDVIVAKFDAEGSEKQPLLAKTNGHGFILVQRMYQRFSVVDGNEPMKINNNKKRE